MASVYGGGGGSGGGGGGGGDHPSREANSNSAFTGKADLGLGGFDFGAGDPLPPSTHRVDKITGFSGTPVFNYTPSAQNRDSPFRSFSRNADIPLLDYLRARKISPCFLNEIDLFLKAHPEIDHYQPHFLSQINHTSPLDAYRFFIKGYTKPARYVEGALPDIYNIPLPPAIPKISGIIDAELVDFFNEYEYRHDILQKIDGEVAGLADALCHNQQISFAQRKLVVYALYGNVVDTYKYYEYNYQQEWLAHRYLPEHVILLELPKPQGYSLPVARQITYPDEDCQEDMRSHSDTRARMARANDAGVDVIEVLLSDFTAALCRQGLRRSEIEEMRCQALRNIDHQRAVGGARDIVDMVMDRAKRTTTADFGRQPTKKVSGRIRRINSLKHSLHRLLTQEATFYDDEPECVVQPIVKTRMRVERELVWEIVYLAEQAGSMSTAQAAHWRSLFSKNAQQAREVAGRRVDVLREMAPYL